MLNYSPENQPYRKIQPSITPEIKLVRIYNDDIFLQERYQKRKIFLGPISLVLEMAGKTLVLSRIGSMESMPEQIGIEFKNPTRDDDRSYTRTMLGGVKDNLIRGVGMVFVPKDFAEELYLEDTSVIIIKSSIPDLSSEFPRPSPLL